MRMKNNFVNFIHTVTKEQLDQFIFDLKGEDDPDLIEFINKLERMN